MFVSDTALMIKNDRSVIRPSDVGKKVLCTNCLEILLSSGATFMVSEDFYVNFGRRYYFIDDIDKSRKFSLRDYEWEPDTDNWNPVLSLEDLVQDAKGTINIGTKKFAKFAGFVCATIRFFQPRGMGFPKNTLKNKEMLKEIHDNFYVIHENNMSLIVNSSKMYSILDALFDLERPSIPDDILFTAPNKWVDSFLDGVISGCIESNGLYTLGDTERLRWFMNDLSVLFLRRHRFMRVKITGSKYQLIPLEKPGATKILRGKYLHGKAVTLYDIGKGEFNLSGLSVYCV